MPFDHEKLDVYKISLDFVRIVDCFLERKGCVPRAAKDQLGRSSLSIPLNIAEGNAKWTPGERRRFFEIAKGSAMESAAILDVLLITQTVSPPEVGEAKDLLVRIVSMLTRMVENEGIHLR
jgi:four helix bundle protein